MAQGRSKAAAPLPPAARRGAHSPSASSGWTRSGGEYSTSETEAGEVAVAEGRIRSVPSESETESEAEEASEARGRAAGFLWRKGAASVAAAQHIQKQPGFLRRMFTTQESSSDESSEAEEEKEEEDVEAGVRGKRSGGGGQGAGEDRAGLKGRESEKREMDRDSSKKVKVSKQTAPAPALRAARQAVFGEDAARGVTAAAAPTPAAVVRSSSSSKEGERAPLLTGAGATASTHDAGSSRAPNGSGGGGSLGPFAVVPAPSGALSKKPRIPLLAGPASPSNAVRFIAFSVLALFGVAMVTVGAHSTFFNTAPGSPDSPGPESLKASDEADWSNKDLAQSDRQIADAVAKEAKTWEPPAAPRSEAETNPTNVVGRIEGVTPADLRGLVGLRGVRLPFRV